MLLLLLSCSFSLSASTPCPIPARHVLADIMLIFLSGILSHHSLAAIMPIILSSCSGCYHAHLSLGILSHHSLAAVMPIVLSSCSGCYHAHLSLGHSLSSSTSTREGALPNRVASFCRKRGDGCGAIDYISTRRRDTLCPSGNQQTLFNFCLHVPCYM